jgi:YVTN family beta-propeller protein
MIFATRLKRTTVLTWAPVLAVLLAAALVVGSAPHFPHFGPGMPLQSSPVALADNGRSLINVNPDANSISLFNAQTPEPTRIAEIGVGGNPVSVAADPRGGRVYVANSLDGTVSIVDIPSRRLANTIPVGVEPMAVATSPNGTRLFVANSASNNLMVVDTANYQILATVDLSPFGTAPRAIAVTNDGDSDDTDETIFVALFFAQLRAGKTSAEEGQDDQREGRVVAISSSNFAPIPGANPIRLTPLANTGVNSNGRLAPASGTVPAIASTNPQTFTTPTGAYPNQLASIAIHPFLSTAYVVSTGASPNGPLRFNSMNQGLVSLFDTLTRTEVTAAQAGSEFRQQAPLNLNQGINLDNALTPRLFLTNPVAMAWRPNGTDAWVVVQNSDIVARLTVDGGGIPTIGAPLAAGPGEIVRVDLTNVKKNEIAGKAPRGIVIDPTGQRAYVSNFVSRSITAIDISDPKAPKIAGTARSTDLPKRNSPEATALLGEELFYTGRGPDGRMSQESWGGCIACHPNGRSDNVTWMFEAGPRQTVPLDGMFDKNNPHDQRALNWSAVRDENEDFELNTRGIFGGRGLIDDDRLFLAIGGATGATPGDVAALEQFQQFTGAVTTTNDLANGKRLPSLIRAFLDNFVQLFSPASATGDEAADDSAEAADDSKKPNHASPALLARRNFAVATLPDDRVFIIGGRTGSGQGTLVTDTAAVLEFNPRNNKLTKKNAQGFTPRHSLGAAAVRTAKGILIYAIGGYSSTAGDAAPVNTVEEYNPSTDSWRTVASLPTAVAQFGITVAGGVNTAEPLQLIHVVSGNTGSEVAPSVANPNPVQRFQADGLSTGSWTSFSPAITLRRNLGAASVLRVVSSRVFVIGGQNAAGTVLPTVEEYIAQTGVLVATPHTDLPAPRARFGIAGTLSSNQIYVMGGIDSLGADQSTILELSVGANGPVAGPAGTPSGVWALRSNLTVARRDLQVSTPPGVTNFLPVQSRGRDKRQDAIGVFIASQVRASRAPVAVNDSFAAAGRQLFGQVGLVTSGVSCATCHGGPKWTRSTIDYTTPPSTDNNLGLGDQRVIGAELRQTLAQGPNVLNNVGTFTATARQNEIRFSAADISQAVAPLGANGFNIPSMLSVHETAPYFYSGLAQTLEEVLNGSQDNSGGTRQHFVTNPENRQALIAFLRSIDSKTPIFP